MTVQVEAQRHEPGQPAPVYDDAGAVCTDYTNGPLVPTVSGEYVNLSEPGDYTIQYNCKDASNNTATPVNRIVQVRDTLCPTVTLNGDPYMYLEAGFDFQDE